MAGPLTPQQARNMQLAQLARSIGSRAPSVGTKDPLFIYASNPHPLLILAGTQGTMTVSIQQAHNYLLRYITGQFASQDWLIQMNLTGLGYNLFDQPTRGALLFGGANANNQVWHHGYILAKPFIVPAGTTVVIQVTGGVANDTFAFSLHGERQTG